MEDVDKDIDPEFLKAREVAEMLRVGEWTVVRWCNEGRFAGAIQLPGGKLWRIPAAEVDKILHPEQGT